MPLRNALSCQENAAEERQTVGIIQCQANLSQMDLAITQLSAPMTAETNAGIEGVAPSKREADEMSSSDRKRHARMRQLRQPLQR